MKVIISTDAGPYAEFVPLVEAAWAELGFGCKTVRVDESNCPPEMPHGSYAKLIRMVEATKTPGVSMISDADMLPIGGWYFKALVDGYEPGTLTAATSDAYGHPEHRLRFPMCYLVADQETWISIVNPLHLETGELLESWRGRKFDGIDDPWVDEFSDESLLVWLLLKWNRESLIKQMIRGCGPDGIATARADRSSWRVDLNALASDLYIDAHMPRPLSKYADLVRPIAEYLGISEHLDGLSK